MRLYNIYGKLVSQNVSKYVINWDKKSRSQLQFKTKQFLKPYWKCYVVYEEFPVYGSLLKVDILNATLRIAVEVHGPQHGEYHYFHNNSPNAYLDSIKRDKKKYDWLKSNDFKLLEINHDEVDTLSPQFFKDKFGIKLN
jgi:hypothetical protein